MIFNRALIIFFTLFFAHAYIPVLAQHDEPDSAYSLSEVTVQAFEQNRKQSHSTATVKVINIPAPFNNKTSIVPALNTVAGVRMEERSPGSYRISIRGSSLRSPFGVRNVKVYWNDIPLTDPGGNTYFNQLAYNNFSSIQVFKGPASSMYGQGTGGLLLLTNEWRFNKTGAEYLGGSFGYHTIMANAVWGSDSAGQSMITYALNRGDGFRDQSAMRRNNVTWTTVFNINKKHSLNASVLFTDMYYQTPGGLTLNEFRQNPRASRPAAGKLPAAKDVNAAIWQKTFTAGITHSNTINQSFNHKTTVYGSYALVKNSAVRNFERRSEPHFGARTMLSYNKKSNSNRNQFRWDNGIEFQQGYFNTQVAGNRQGSPDSLQTNDDINAAVLSFLTQANFDAGEHWVFTAGASLNQSKVNITRLSIFPVKQQRFSFNNEFAPRIAVLRRFNNEWSVAANIAKGFSPPTIAELLPSTGVITPLSAEHGWNYEMILRKYIRRIRLDFEMSSYLFKLSDALVQRRDEAGADYFVNAGKINQKGIEAYLGHTVIPWNSNTIDYLVQKLSYTYSHFRYGSFIKGKDDFTGNAVPGVPIHAASYNADLNFVNGLYVNANYYAASKIFMNDGNTEAAAPYYLLGLRSGWKTSVRKKKSIDMFGGVDNLLNQVYSLGNDINAAGRRYYNAAPGRNYYAGISFKL